MRQAILIINLGSSSLKFSVFAIEDNKLNTTALAKGQFALEKNHIQNSIFELLLKSLEEKFPEVHFIAAGHRVVHGGNLFTQPVLITDEILKTLRTFCSLAPLHQPYNLAGIEILAQQLPEMKQVACFDTAFHATQPKVAQGYAIPETVSKNLIKRYGFHGLSYEYIAHVLPNYLDQRANGKLIVAHLGHGASLCAMQERKSVATTMGFTALDGLPMGTRCGSLDPGIILYLIAHEKMTVNEVTDLLYNQCGLLGVSEMSSDVRELIASDDERARYAIDLFIYRTVREIGSLTAALTGLDALIFTGGIGEHRAYIREKICQPLKWLGIHLDLNANKRNETKISTDESTIPVLIIPTHEELMIAQHTWRCINH